MENIQLLIEQANANDAIAQYKLGRAYETGDGVEQDIVTARMWYQKSADNGNSSAAVKLKVMPAQDGAHVAQATTTNAYIPPKAPTLPMTNKQGAGSTVTNPTKPAGAQKSKAAAVVLALFLGCYGIHDFYLGYTKQGIIKLVLTFTIVGAIVSQIWTLVDLIKIICNGKFDANGQKLN